MRRDPIKPDPKMVRLGRSLPPRYRCAAEGCTNELNEVTIKNVDPFCSTNCAKTWHGVDITIPGNGVFVGSSS
jgi:hypothetical protein